MDSTLTRPLCILMIVLDLPRHLLDSNPANSQHAILLLVLPEHTRTSYIQLCGNVLELLGNFPNKRCFNNSILQCLHMSLIPVREKTGLEALYYTFPNFNIYPERVNKPG